MADHSVMNSSSTVWSLYVHPCCDGRDSALIRWKFGMQQRLPFILYKVDMYNYRYIHNHPKKVFKVPILPSLTSRPDRQYQKAQRWDIQEIVLQRRSINDHANRFTRQSVSAAFRWRLCELIRDKCNTLSGSGLGLCKIGRRSKWYESISISFFNEKRRTNEFD